VGGTSIGRPYVEGSFSVASEGGAIAYTAGSPDRPAEVGLLQGGDSRVLTALNEDVLPFLDLASIEEIHVASSHDGRDIEAWVALPPGFRADGSFPLILEIHGGPFAMYGPFFAAEIQRYAVELRSMTGGRGTFNAVHDHYELLPAHLTEKVKQSVAGNGSGH